MYSYLMKNIFISKSRSSSIVTKGIYQQYDFKIYDIILLRIFLGLASNIVSQEIDKIYIPRVLILRDEQPAFIDILQYIC
jgi:hypothetical protein